MKPEKNQNRYARKTRGRGRGRRRCWRRTSHIATSGNRTRPDQYSQWGRMKVRAGIEEMLREAGATRRGDRGTHRRCARADRADATTPLRKGSAGRYERGATGRRRSRAAEKKRGSPAPRQMSSFCPLYMSGVTYPKLGDSMISSWALKTRAASLSLLAHLNQIGTAMLWKFSRSSAPSRLISVPTSRNFFQASMSAFWIAAWCSFEYAWISSSTNCFIFGDSAFQWFMPTTKSIRSTGW